MRRVLLLVGIVTTLFLSMPVQASSFDLQETETETEKIATLKFHETKEGMVSQEDIPETYEYEGKEYKLVSADIEYSYVKGKKDHPIGNVTETYPLNAGEVKSIPQYVTVGNILYVLDPNSLSVQTTVKENIEGSDVLTKETIVENLSDNDLKRLPLEIKEDGVTYELLTVTYTVTEEDEYGIPISYKAHCYYGGLKNYTVSNDTAWEVSAVYTGYRSKEYVKSSDIDYVYELREELEPEIKVVEPTVTVTEEEEQKNYLLPIVIGSTGGILFVVLGGILLTTIPVYAAMSTGDYRYIGRIRLKHRKEYYECSMGERISKRGETGNFMLKLPKRIQTNGNIEMLHVKTPDGAVLKKRVQTNVMFRLP